MVLTETLKPLRRTLQEIGLACNLVPACSGYNATVTVENRRSRQPGRDEFAPRDPTRRPRCAFCNLQEREQRSADDGLSVCDRQTSVPGDAGGVKLFGGDALIGIALGVEDGDAMQRLSAARPLAEPADHVSNLLLGVGRLEDALSAWQGCDRSAPLRLRPGSEGVRVYLRVAAEPDNYFDHDPFGQRREEAALLRREIAGEIEDDVADISQQAGLALPERQRGGLGEFAVVIERSHALAELAVATDEVALALAERGDPLQRAVIAGVEISEDCVEATQSRSLKWDITQEIALGLGDNSADGLYPEGIGERTPALRGEQRRADELDQARQHQHTKVDHTAGSHCQRASQAQSGNRVRRHDSDGGEPITALQALHHSLERVAGRAPHCRCRDLQSGHAPTVSGYGLRPLAPCSICSPPALRGEMSRSDRGGSPLHRSGWGWERAASVPDPPLPSASPPRGGEGNEHGIPPEGERGKKARHLLPEGLQRSP